MDAQKIASSENTEENAVLQSYGRELLSFSTVDVEEPYRGRNWFMGLGVCIVFGVFYGIIADSLSFVILCMLIVGVYMVSHRRKPQVLEVMISDTGIKWGSQFFFYPQIRAFWVFWTPGELQTLNFQVQEGFVKEINIPIKGQDVALIRETLSFYLPEIEGKSESLSSFFIRKLKL